MLRVFSQDTFLKFHKNLRIGMLISLSVRIFFLSPPISCEYCPIQSQTLPYIRCHIRFEIFISGILESILYSAVQSNSRNNCLISFGHIIAFAFTHLFRHRNYSLFSSLKSYDNPLVNHIPKIEIIAWLTICIP